MLSFSEIGGVLSKVLQDRALRPQYSCGGVVHSYVH